jgi:hypothetical protein
MIITPGVPPLEESHEEPDPILAIDDGDDLEVARELANRLNAAEDRWFVMYGAGSRTYWAFPLWDPGARMILEADRPERLRALMRRAEAR